MCYWQSWKAALTLQLTVCQLQYLLCIHAAQLIMCSVTLRDNQCFSPLLGPCFWRQILAWRTTKTSNSVPESKITKHNEKDFIFQLNWTTISLSSLTGSWPVISFVVLYFIWCCYVRPFTLTQVMGQLKNSEVKKKLSDQGNESVTLVAQTAACLHPQDTVKWEASITSMCVMVCGMGKLYCVALGCFW